LTPQERAVAREQYKSMKQLPPEKKAEVRQRWQEYQTLPPETKRELALQPTPPAGHPPAAHPSANTLLTAPPPKPVQAPAPATSGTRP